MLMVRSCASGELSALSGRTGAPVLPDIAQLDAETFGLIASNGDGEPQGGALLMPQKRVAGKVISYRVVWLYTAPEAEAEVECRILHEAAAMAANRGAKAMQVSVRPKNGSMLAACEKLPPVEGLSVVISLQYNGL